MVWNDSNGQCLFLLEFLSFTEYPGDKNDQQAGKEAPCALGEHLVVGKNEDSVEEKKQAEASADFLNSVHSRIGFG